MHTYTYLKAHIEGAICTITLQRPDKLNALNIALLEELHGVFSKLYDMQDVRGVILTGAGDKAFAAGADIGEIAELNDIQARKFSENGQEVFALIENCPKPVVAAVNGFALGGGCELAMACHIRVAVRTARFGQPEVNLGLIPGYGGTQRLTQLVGKAKAMEWMLTADMITAEEALQWGLANHIADDHESMMALCQKLIQKISSKAPLAVAEVLSCVQAVFQKETNGYQQEANSFSRLCKTADFKEGTSAFVQKRAAVFTGK